MISARTVYSAIHDALTELSGVAAVYYQQADEQVPTFPGSPYVQPYVILGLRIPRVEDDLPVSGEQMLDARVFRIQTQCVAANAETLMDMVDAVTTKLTGLRIERGALWHDGEAEPTDPVLLDREVSPHRPFAPLMWRISTQ